MIVSRGYRLWNKAKKKIVGGNMLFSKRPDNFLPNSWPTYYSKAIGCYVWDLSNKKYVDISLMGVGTNILGYANKEVDSSVIKNIKKSVSSTLNCPEEVELAERLLEMNPWAKKVKFARTGGEANAIAIRIARAFTRSTKVAICGYHGWHDWYLSTNLRSKNNLQNMLLKGLNTEGVPKELADTVHTFLYNKIDDLEKLLKEKKIKIIKMEVMRNIYPEKDYLSKVRNLANKYNALLIFDECTSGFRETFGGLYKKYKVVPDMVIFGKALGNGYAITAIVGKDTVMEAGDNSFISSTFWTERIGPTAALKTLHVMKKLKSWEYITQQGKKIKEEWKKISHRTGLEIKISGLDSNSSFVFNDKLNNFYKTFITSEMLKKGFLASNSISLSMAHNDKIVNKYLKNLSLIFEKIAKLKIKKIKKIKGLKEARIGFYRLN